jgi:hypothetical protein
MGPSVEYPHDTEAHHRMLSFSSTTSITGYSDIMSGARFFSPPKKRKASPGSVAHGSAASRLRHPILLKPFGWKKEVAEAFTYEDKEASASASKTTRTSKGEEVKYKVLRCNVENKHGDKCDRATPMQVGSGIGNAFKHTLSHFNNDEDVLLDAYVDALLKADYHGGPISKHVLIDQVSVKEKAMVDWIKVLVLMNVPLCAVKNKIFRAFCRHDDNFSIEMVKETLFQLWVLVLERVSDEMKKALIGGIMHDGWTKNRTHYFGLIAVYIKSRREFHDGVPTVVETVKSALLSVSPLLRVSDSVEDDSFEAEEATGSLRRFTKCTLSSSSSRCLKLNLSVGLSARWLTTARSISSLPSTWRLHMLDVLATS